jgi:hypothetical protein
LFISTKLYFTTLIQFADFFHGLTVASTLFAAALGLRVGLAANRRRCVDGGFLFV